MNDLFSLQGKIALITGGSRGIGRMMAKGFLQAGAKVYIASRKKEDCDQVAAELSEFGPCFSLPADVSTEAGVLELVAELKQHEQALHILVNNAGRAWGATLETYPDEAFDQIMALNVKSAFHLTRHLLGLLEAAASPDDPARVVNIGSAAGMLTGPTTAFAYGVSKAAIHHLTRILADELSARHVTVNAIAPGRFPSRMTAYVLQDQERYDLETSIIPLGRFGREEDIQGLSICLCSRAGAYMTGNVIPLDGGALIKGLDFGS